MTSRLLRVRALLSLPSGTWLTSQPEEFQQKIAEVARFRDVKAGETIWNVGDDFIGLMGMISGCASVHWSTPGNDISMLNLFWPGDWMGEHALITDSPYKSGAYVRTDGTIVTIAAAPLREMLRQEPGWWLCLGKLSAEHTLLASHIAVDMMMRSHTARCISVLLRGAGSHSQSRGAVRSRIVPLTHEELGVLTNLSRNAIGAILHELQEDRLIELHYRSVELKEVEALRERIRQSLSSDD